MADNQHLTIAQAANYLNVSIQSLRRWADAEQIPYWRTPGRERRFDREALDEWIASNRGKG